MAILFHIILSGLTTAILCIAGLLASLLAVQERRLRYKPATGWSSRLPPLETLESRLFQLNTLGFAFLTAVLMTGFYVYPELLQGHPMLLQKIFLAVVAWLIFFVLLLGRYWRGWRGLQAIHSTWCGVALLIIIYFASRFI